MQVSHSVERQAVQAHVAEVLANTRTKPALMLFATRIDRRDGPGASVRHIGIIEPATSKLSWTYLVVLVRTVSRLAVGKKKEAVDCSAAAFLLLVSLAGKLFVSEPQLSSARSA